MKNANLFVTLVANVLAAVAGIASAADGSAPPTAAKKATGAMSLPATYTGVLPCADCAGVVHTLTLRQDGLYFLRLTYLGKPGDPFSETGVWALDTNTSELTLRRGSDRDRFRVGSEALVKLDQTGQPIQSSTNLTLRRTLQVDKTADTVRWHGKFSYMADAAHFVTCDSADLRWPVAMQADYLALERGYSQLRNQPGNPMLVSFDGRLAFLPAMEGPDREQLVVDKFVAVHPGASCPPELAGQNNALGRASPVLRNTKWQLEEIAGRKVTPSARGPSINMTLASDDNRVTGFSGCNRMMGGFSTEGDQLTFTQTAGTMMACAAADMAQEREFLTLLPSTTHYRIDDMHLTLLKGNGVLARFTAVPAQ